MTRTIVHSDTALPVLPVFSQAVVSRGYVHVSGNIGCDRDFKLLEGGVKVQARAALENICKVLKAAGSGLEHVVKANIYFTDIKEDFKPMNEVYAEFFDMARCLPAHACRSLHSLSALASRWNAWLKFLEF